MLFHVEPKFVFGIPCLSLSAFLSASQASPVVQWAKNPQQCRRHRRHGFDLWVRKIPWRRKWQPTAVLLPGESQGRGDLVGCRPWVTRSWTLLKQLSSSRETHGASRVAQWLKNLPANAGDKGSISVSERSTGEGNGSPLQCSCLGNPMDRGAWQAAVNGVTKELDSTK